MTKVAIVDSGGANIASVRFALERLNVDALLTDDAAQIAAAERVILPGVGTAKDAMQRLKKKGLVDTIRNLSAPTLGVCLGMQLLFDGSEEDDVECLGIIPGTARKLAAAPEYPVPNMGWCETTPVKPHPMVPNPEHSTWFYFVHGFAVPPGDHTIAVASHTEPFSAISAQNNFIAAQFHPERSAKAGSRLLASFLGVGS